MMNLSRLIYVSRASRRLSIDEVRAIADVATSRNGRCGVSGLLVHDRGMFLQVLEGDVFVLVELFERIAADPRHVDVRRLVFGPARSRIFSAWNMGLVDLSAPGPGDAIPLAAIEELGGAVGEESGRDSAMEIVHTFLGLVRERAA